MKLHALPDSEVCTRREVEKEGLGLEQFFVVFETESHDDVNWSSLI